MTQASGVTVRVLREVDPVRLLSGPIRSLLDGVLLLAHGEVVRPGRAPIDTGTLRGSLAPGAGVSMVDPKNPPGWARLGSNVTVAGTSYPTVLEESDRLHYAGGPSLGKPTKGWLSQTVKNVKPDVEGLLDKTADDIERGWRK